MSTTTLSSVALHGVLVVDKPPGPTSHDVVDRVRRSAGTRRVRPTGAVLSVPGDEPFDGPAGGRGGGHGDRGGTQRGDVRARDRPGRRRAARHTWSSHCAPAYAVRPVLVGRRRRPCRSERGAGR